MSLVGQRILVTGAARGIGRACALALTREGADIIAADRLDCDDTVAAIESAGGRATGAAVDVGEEAAVMALFERTIDPAPLHALVHCAGVIHEAPLLDTDAAIFDEIIRVNLRGTFLVGREALRRLHATGGGRVVLTSSDLAHTGRATFSSYCASKAGVLGLARSWAHEFAPSITVNALCPGPVDTAMLDLEHMSAQWRAKEMDNPSGRFGRPEEIAAMAVLLCGEGGSFITGQGLNVNGGTVML